ncbi:MAG: transcriptional regulator [Myxococcota bacterium]
MTCASPSLFEIFAAALPLAASRAHQEELTSRLDSMLAEAHAAWPQLAIRDADFVGFVAARLEGETLDALTRVRAADLYLAHACAAGVVGAVAAFDIAHGAAVAELLRKRGVDAITAAEIKQQIYARLFVGDGVAPPKIDTYHGRGSLAGWLRVATTRTYLNHVRGQRREVTLDEAMLATVAGGGHDPELELLKSTYRSEFKTAFAAAVTALTPRQRNLMRQQFIDGLSVDDLADLYHVHRTTAGRWLAAAQERLLTRTRHDLMVRLSLGHAEIDSVMRLIRSRVELSLDSALRRAEREP